jgi:deoxyribodipyrimidine photo-lyase
VNVVWFKRDLRIDDHEPLARAAAAGPCVLMYIHEPSILRGDDVDAIHVQAFDTALAAIDAELLARYGTRLTYRIGDAVAVFEQLHAEIGLTALYSHEETGNAATYARDLAVQRWARERGVRWYEYPQFGVVRRLRSRDGWAKQWERRMGREPLAAPERIVPATAAHRERPTPAELGFTLERDRTVQPTGLVQARLDLASFLTERATTYRRAMSSPLSGEWACSRLSLHLATGSISLRTVTAATRARRAGLPPGLLSLSLKSFEARLHWHCHFIQKLEDEPGIEFRNINRAYDGLREDEFDEARFAAWAEGRTGFPMVDACMRSLRATGWLNFRMRAMLVSFASYYLWLHWRKPALHLARLFADYEPGIHYSQTQMQAGVTGINTLRIYSPRKQAEDQDPDGIFIRRWVPELAHVPREYLAEPHLMPELLQAAYGVRIGVDYPLPIVETKAALAHARARFKLFREKPEMRATSAEVFRKHGSRNTRR